MKSSSFKVLHETTKWDCGFKVKNNLYLVKGSRLYAYIQEGVGKPIYLKQPILFDQRGRTFNTLKGNPFDLTQVNS